MCSVWRDGQGKAPDAVRSRDAPIPEKEADTDFLCFADLALNAFYWYFSIKKIKVSENIGENFKIPIPRKMADTTDTIGASPIRWHLMNKKQHSSNIVFFLLRQVANKDNYFK